MRDSILDALYNFGKKENRMYKLSLSLLSFFLLLKFLGSRKQQIIQLPLSTILR